jgi:hypothetical protein
LLSLLRLVPRLPAAEQPPERAERRGDGAHESVALRLRGRRGVGRLLCADDDRRRARETQVGAARADFGDGAGGQQQRDQK